MNKEEFRNAKELEGKIVIIDRIISNYEATFETDPIEIMLLKECKDEIQHKFDRLFSDKVTEFAGRKKEAKQGINY